MSDDPRVQVAIRVRRSVKAAVEERAKARDCSASDVWREIMALGVAQLLADSSVPITAVPVMAGSGQEHPIDAELRERLEQKTKIAHPFVGTGVHCQRVGCGRAQSEHALTVEEMF